MWDEIRKAVARLARKATKIAGHLAGYLAEMGEIDSRKARPEDYAPVAKRFLADASVAPMIGELPEGVQTALTAAAPAFFWLLDRAAEGITE